MIKRAFSFSIILFLCGCKADNGVTDEQKYLAVTHYADLAYLMFQDARITAENLQHRVEELLNSPDEQHLAVARTAWLNARKPYLQTEVIRNGNPGFNTYQQKVNGWPVMNDAVEEMLRRNDEFSVTSIAKLITPSNEPRGIVSGYHIIESLLWGDHNRPITDFIATRHCTSNNQLSDPAICQHRRDYLMAASKTLASDLKQLEKEWSADERNNFRTAFLKEKLPEVYAHIISGLASVSLGQLAGQHLKAPFATKSLLETEDAGSLSFHTTLSYTEKGVRDIFYGTYEASDGSRYTGDNMEVLLSKLNPDLQQNLRNALKDTHVKLDEITNAIEKKHIPFQQLIASETPERLPNLENNQLIHDAIDALVKQAHLFEATAASLGSAEIRVDSSGFTF